MLVLCFFFAGSGSNSTGTPPLGLPQVTVDAKGKANAIIPIAIAVGTKNIHPQLSLSYHSDVGDGILGQGWQLKGLHYIARDTSLQVNYNSKDRYISSLSGRLVENDSSQTSTPKNFIAKNDPFITYVAKTSGCGSTPAICSWEATAKDGTKYYFGTTSNSRVEAIASKNDADIQVWSLDKVEDLHGNAYTITYKKAIGVSYVQQIEYANRKIVFGYDQKDHSYFINPKDGEVQISKRLKNITIKHTINGAEVTVPHGLYTFHYDTDSYKFTKAEFLSKVERSGYKPVNITYNNTPIYEREMKQGKVDQISFSIRAPVDKGYIQVCRTGALACLCLAASSCIDPNEAKIICGTYMQHKDRCDGGDTWGINKFFPVDINGDGKKELFRLVGDGNDNNKGIYFRYQKIGENSNSDIDLRLQKYSLSFNSFTQMIDINGDGKDDFFFTKRGASERHHVHVAFSNGSGFDSIVNTGIKTSIPNYDFKKSLQAQENRGRQWIIDINQDGRADFIQKIESQDETNQSRPDEERNWELSFHLSNGRTDENAFEPPKIIKLSHKSTGKIDGNWNHADEFTQIVDMDRSDGMLNYVNIRKDTDTLIIYKIDLENRKLIHHTTFSLKIVGTETREEREHNMWLTDVNGDGKLDLVVLKNRTEDDSQLITHFYSGSKFIGGITPVVSDLPSKVLRYNKNAPQNEKFKKESSVNTFTDVNNDGKADFVYYNNGNINVVCSNGYQFDTEVCDFSISGDPLIAIADVDGNGRLDFIQATVEKNGINNYVKTEHQISVHYLKQAFHGKLKSVSGGYKQKTELNYALAPLPSENSHRNYPYLPYTYPNQVVRKLILKQDANSIATSEFTYSENRFYHSSDPEVRKVLGFSTITKSLTMGSKKTKDVNTYSQDYHKAGALLSQKHYVNDKITYQKDTNYEKVVFNNSNWVRETSSTEYHYTEDTTSPLVTVNTTLTYLIGNVQKKKITTTQKTQSGITPETFVESFEMTNYNVYGKPRNIVKKSGGQILEKVEYVIDVKNNIKEKKLSISDTEGDSITSYTYDSYGNVHTKTDPNGNVTTIDYDTDVYAFPTEIKHSYKGKEYTIKMEYDTFFGKMTSKKDTSGVKSYIDYDSYGRKLKVWYPGNSKKQDNYNEKYTYIDTDDEHSVTKFLKESSSGEYWYKEYMDDLGRVYKTETKAKSGVLTDNVVTEVIEYYENTRLIEKKSIPYFYEKDKRYIVFEYDYLERPEKITYPNGSTKSYTYNGFIITIDSSGTGQVVTKMNAKKQITSKTEKGITTTYTYFPSGKTDTVSTSAGDETNTTYNRLGKLKTKTTPNSGTVTMTYYSNGLLETEQDTRGKIITYKYDTLDRLTELQRPDGESPILYEYYKDGLGSLGKLKKIADDSGTTEFFYNTKGQLNAKMVKIDDYSFIFRYTYDGMGRLNKITYPNGVAVNQIYSESGHLQKLTMDSASDNGNMDNLIVSYGIDPSNHNLIRLSGNNVKTTITYNEVTRKPIRLKTDLANGDTVQNWKYTYKNNGLLESIEDYTYSSDMWSGKYTQIFGYDDKDRLNSAEGYFGPNRERQTLSYHYDDKGNMDTKGDITLTYTHANHPHAVSSATSPSIGTINYDYDAAGNMIHRENDDFHYNSLGKLIQINKQSGEVVDYEYNYTGNRIKKSITNGASVATTYNIDGLYEVNVIPGKAVRHTLYVRGAEGDLVAQLTTENVELLTTVAEAPKTFSLDRFVTYLQMEVSKFFYYTNLENPYNLKLYAFYALLIVGLLYVFSLKLVEISNQESLSTRKFSTFSMLISQLTIVAVLFSCMPKALTGSSGNEDPPFWLVTSFVNGGGGIDAETPAVTDTPGSLSPAYNSGLPTTGMFFIHPDHLGSTSMLTNAKGEMVAGVDINSGKSYVSYKPYGEVNKTNSSGPDIFRYKYTAQEADSETGLHYYKSRYYDPVTGHFTQADTFVSGDDIMGQNQYMYTYGDPMNHIDPSGHSILLPLLSYLVGSFVTYKIWKAIDPAGAHIAAEALNLQPEDINLTNLAITAVVTVAAFGAAVYLGAWVGSIAQGFANSSILPAVPTYFGGNATALFINTTIQFGIEGVLGYYAGNFVSVIGREIGRVLGSLFTYGDLHLNSQAAMDGAEIGKEAGNTTNDFTEIAADMFSPHGPNIPESWSNDDWSNLFTSGYDHPSFHTIYDSAYQFDFYGTADGFGKFLYKNAMGTGIDWGILKPYYKQHTMWGKTSDVKGSLFDYYDKKALEAALRGKRFFFF